MAGRTSIRKARRRVLLKLPIHAAPWVAIKTVANSFTQPRGRFYEIPRALWYAFFEGMTESISPMWGNLLPSLRRGTASRRPAPITDSRARREERALPIVPMSSGRLFLDRVGRHQSPSPLHRHGKNTMHFAEHGQKGTFLLCLDTRLTKLAPDPQLDIYFKPTIYLSITTESKLLH